MNETIKQKGRPKAASTAYQTTDAASLEYGAPAQSSEQTQAVGKNNLTARTNRCWFRVMSGSRPDEKGPVFAAVNGDSVLIKRNHWVELPTHFLPVFEDALSSEVIIADDGKSSTVRDVPRFNFEVRSISDGKPRESNLPKGF